jgi:cellulose synthase/poly-beta-1,6-N-acetylglucosamine synthase-like glycosyltransferase
MRRDHEVIAEICVWACVGIVGYVYVGYPLLVKAMSHMAGSPSLRAPIRPTVTVIVAAYNEEKNIRGKLDNILGLEYPRGRMDVVVASDMSTDSTDSIVKMYDAGPVQLLRLEGRQGKTACQNAAAGQAIGEILVFTDATTRLASGAIAALVDNFADARVGCVAGLLVYEAQSNSATAQGGTEYWGYEIGLRRAESRLAGLVGVSGCLYAVRRSAYRPIAPTLISDFVVALQVREHGLKTVLEPAAACYENTLDHAGGELAMRVRVAIRSIHALVVERRVLNPLRYGLFAWQVWSHKVLRYASPFFILLCFLATVALYRDPRYLAFAIAQFLFVAIGTIGFLLDPRTPHIGVLRKPYYFLLTNLASFIAVLRYARGDRIVTWTPVR